MLQMKKKRSQRVRSEGSAVTVSVNDKSLKDFEKFYSSTNIDGKPEEKQLRRWSNLLRIGKKIRVLIAFNYGHDDNHQARPASRRVEKRGRVSALVRCWLSVKHILMRKKMPPDGLQPGVLCTIVCDVAFARVHSSLIGAGRTLRNF